MKTVLSVLMLIVTGSVSQVFAQTELPDFLQGTWKMEDQEIYEDWEILDDGSMKGHSYKMASGEEVISEYLEIRKQDDAIIYTATVLNQNDGKGVDFTLNQPDSLTFSFENPEHDFPKKIIYQKHSGSEIYVSVSDGGEQGFAYLMKKVTAGKPDILLSFFDDKAGIWIASPEIPDYTSVDSVLEHLYDSITFNDDKDPDWKIFRTLFIDQAKLIPAAAGNLTVLSTEEYIQNFQGQIDSGSLEHFLEREISRKTDRFGNVLHVLSTYETEFSTPENPEGYSRGINSIQLIWNEGRWWVASIIWDSEREGQTIPDEYQ